mgnify:CR=1 FL=1
MEAGPCDSAQASTDYLEIRDRWFILRMCTVHLTTKFLSSREMVKPWEYCAMNSVGRRVEMRCFKVVDGGTGFIIMVRGEDGPCRRSPVPGNSRCLSGFIIDLPG